MAKIRKKKLKNKRLGDFLAALKGSARNHKGEKGRRAAAQQRRTERSGTGGRKEAEPLSTKERRGACLLC